MQHYAKRPVDTKTFHGENLPPEFVKRPDVFEPLKKHLLDGKNKNVAITAALRGAGGYGKTTIALALCHDEDIQKAFPDGIFWVTLGQNQTDPEILIKLNELIERITGSKANLKTLDGATEKLAEVLYYGERLLVIDDVWEYRHLNPFLQGGETCTRLITTRDDSVVPPNAFKTIVDNMTEEQSVELLGWRLPEPTREDFLQLARRLGTYALLLKIANGALRKRIARGDSISNALKWINKALSEKGLDALRDDQSKNERHRAVSACLEVSLDLLDDRTRHVYNRLVIFPEDANIPLSTLRRWWDLGEIELEDLCEQLASMSLLQSYSLDNRTIRLHDVLHQYLIDTNAHFIKSWQNTFLDNYEISEWHNLPEDEPYLWDNLAYHLFRAERFNDLKGLFATQDWMHTRVKHDGYVYDGFLADLDIVWKKLAE